MQIKKIREIIMVIVSNDKCRQVQSLEGFIRRRRMSRRQQHLSSLDLKESQDLSWPEEIAK
jgi:hypothetical protein